MKKILIIILAIFVSVGIFAQVQNSKTSSVQNVLTTNILTLAGGAINVNY